MVFFSYFLLTLKHIFSLLVYNIVVLFTGLPWSSKQNTGSLQNRENPAWVCVCQEACLHLWQQPEALCVSCFRNGICVCVCVISDSSGKAQALFCSVSFLFPSFSWSKKICLKVAALCYPAAPEYNNRRSISRQKPNKKIKRSPAMAMFNSKVRRGNHATIEEVNVF